MSTKHTPGPWKTDGNIVFSDPGNVVAYLVDADNARQCGVRSQVKNRSQNSRLIAAAPELLGMLLRLRSWIDDNPNTPPRLIGQLAYDLDAVIGQAEGVQNKFHK